MTRTDALDILLTNDLEYFAQRIPIGVTVEQVLKQVIEIASGTVLDYVAPKHFGITRLSVDEICESDMLFRKRILHLLGLDQLNKICAHSWTTYDSGWSKYEYCSKCDVKNV